MKISQSILSQVDKCGLAAQFTLDTPVWFKRATSGSRAVGTGFHAGLQYGYEHRQDYGDFPPLQNTLDVAVKTFRDELVHDHYTNTPVEVVKWDDKVPDEATGVAILRAMLMEYFEGKNAEGKNHYWPLDWRVVAIEHPFKMAAADRLELTSNGIDLLMESPDGRTLVGEDHKTANKAWDQHKALPRKNNQAPMMTWAMRQIWPDYAFYRFCFGIIIYPGKATPPRFERRISDPTPAHEAAILKKAVDFAFLYETIHIKAGMDLPANPASTLCNPKWCDFFDGCPHGAALDT